MLRKMPQVSACSLGGGRKQVANSPISAYPWLTQCGMSLAHLERYSSCIPSLAQAGCHASGTQQLPSRGEHSSQEVAN